MDLRDDIQVQLADLSDWIRQIANDDKLAAPATRAEAVEGLLDRATFLDTFVIPRVAPSAKHLALEKFENAAGVLSMVKAPPLADTRNGIEDHQLATERNGDDDDRPFVREPSQ